MPTLAPTTTVATPPTAEPRQCNESRHQTHGRISRKEMFRQTVNCDGNVVRAGVFNFFSIQASFNASLKFAFFQQWGFYGCDLP